MKTQTRICRPSRFQQRYAGYEVTCSGLAMVNALKAVREGETALKAMATDTYSNGYSVDAHKTIQARYQTARTRLQNRLR